MEVPALLAQEVEDQVQVPQAGILLVAHQVQAEVASPVVREIIHLGDLQVEDQVQAGILLVARQVQVEVASPVVREIIHLEDLQVEDQVQVVDRKDIHPVDLQDQASHLADLQEDLLQVVQDHQLVLQVDPPVVKVIILVVDLPQEDKDTLQVDHPQDNLDSHQVLQEELLQEDQDFPQGRQVAKVDILVAVLLQADKDILQDLLVGHLQGVHFLRGHRVVKLIIPVEDLLQDDQASLQDHQVDQVDTQAVDLPQDGQDSLQVHQVDKEDFQAVDLPQDVQDFLQDHQVDKVDSQAVDLPQDVQDFLLDPLGKLVDKAGILLVDLLVVFHLVLLAVVNQVILEELLVDLPVGKVDRLVLDPADILQVHKDPVAHKDLVDHKDPVVNREQVDFQELEAFQEDKVDSQEGKVDNREGKVDSQEDKGDSQVAGQDFLGDQDFPAALAMMVLMTKVIILLSLENPEWTILFFPKFLIHPSDVTNNNSQDITLTLKQDAKLSMSALTTKHTTSYALTVQSSIKSISSVFGGTNSTATVHLAYMDLTNSSTITQ